MAGSGPILASRYRLLEKIGEGGAAEVFRARDERLDRIVAVKLLRPQFSLDQQSRSRFVIEARAAAALSHPNIVDVYDFGEGPDGSMFIAMQYVAGENLKDIIQRRGRLSPGEMISIARQVCRALAVAHAKGLIHRDVKPQNIMIDQNGDVRLTDFGVVKALAAPALTQSGMTFGTAAYLSPEQATGAPIGPASDIYSLGCVMYELLTGMPPFTGDNPAVVAYKQVWEQPRPLHEVVSDVPPSLEGIVMRCLDKEPSRRYSSVDDLGADLDRVSVGSNQPTQAVQLGAVAAEMARSQTYTPATSRAPAERIHAIPVQPSPDEAGAGGAATVAVPPVRISGGGQGAGVGVMPAGAEPVRPYHGTGIPSPTQALEAAPVAYGGYRGAPPPPGPQVVNVSDRRRGIGWLPVLLILLLLLSGFAFALWQGRQFLPGFNGGNTPVAGVVSGGTATPTAAGAFQVPPTPTALSAIGVPTAIDTPPPPTATATATQAASTDTPAPAPPAPPTVTAAPPPAPTDTPAPPPPTDTPAPPEPTPAPPAPGAARVTLDDAAFAGGYTRANGTYHGRTAHWVYGQGTPYSTMSAQFNVDQPPAGEASLLIVGVDSEDPPKTPIQIALNGVVIFQGPDPLPNDSRSGPGGPGNWGSFTWTIPAGVIQPGANTLSITNLDPSDKINYPIFFMLDYAAISWGG